MKHKIYHFSLSLPKGPGQDNVPGLLRHLANAIEEEGDIEIQDIVFHVDIIEAESWPAFTVYYDEKDNDTE